jgi:hypothetical protein
MTEEQAERAGRMMKVLKLANMPGMDAVAVKLNCGLTWSEKEEAIVWGKAFEIAEKPDGKDIFTLANELRQALRWRSSGG